VLIRKVNPTSAAAAHLRSDDVLMSFDGQAIAGDGTVPFRLVAARQQGWYSSVMQGGDMQGGWVCVKHFTTLSLVKHS